MRALVVHGPGRATLDDVPQPEPGPGEALVRTTAVALCGSDARIYRGDMHDASYPLVPGHEWVGTVADAPGAPQLTGAVVVGDNLVPCRHCLACAAGRTNLCAALDEVGFTLPGACADAFVAPAANLYPLPAGADVASACLAEPAAVAVHAVDRAAVSGGESVLVLGAGAVGLLVAQVARARGAEVTVADPLPARRRHAAGLGLRAVEPAAAERADADVVFEASGSAHAFPLAVRAARPAGRVCQVGYASDEATSFTPSLLMLKELTVVGSLSAHESWPAAVDLLAGGHVELRPLVTHRFPLADYAAAFDTLADPASGALRVVLDVSP